MGHERPVSDAWGPRARPAWRSRKRLPSKAAATICIGSCSCFGNIQAAKPNPTDARASAMPCGIKTVNIAGLPAQPGRTSSEPSCTTSCSAALPPWIHLGRPSGHTASASMTTASAGRIMMPANTWKNGAMTAPRRAGACTKWAARAPTPMPTARRSGSTTACPGRSWQATAAWAAPSPAFWDSMAPLEKPIAEKTVGGWGVTARIDALGAALAGATVAGIAAHAGLTGGQRLMASRRSPRLSTDRTNSRI